MLLTIASFIFVLGILIFIHELGHFLIAKKVGIKVETFSLGFPPNLVSKKFGETVYAIGIIPLGGFVKMAGENPDDKSTGSPDEFMAKTVGQRAAVIFAGPFMNYLLAICIMIGVFYLTGKPIYDQGKIVVGQVIKDDPADKAGLQENDQIIALNGAPVTSYDSLRVGINSVVEKPVELTWIHQNDTISKNIITRAEQVPNMNGGVDTIGLIGFNQKPIRYERIGFLSSVQQGFLTTHVIVWETLKFVKKVVSGQVSSKMIGGPLFIAQQSGREARQGASSLFFFMALLSVNLAVLNVLPIPVLDGGHLLFLALEKIKGGPLSTKARMVAQQVGLVLLLGVIILVTYNDILRVIRGY